MNYKRYIEKSCGTVWVLVQESHDSGNHKYTLVRYDDLHKRDRESTTVTDKQLKEFFDYNPIHEPIVDVQPAKLRYPIRIRLRCPECGSLLKQEGGIVCPPVIQCNHRCSVIQYNHRCSNPDCKYEQLVSSYYTGMIAAVTEEQQQKIAAGTYDERTDGKIFALDERDLLTFKNETNKQKL